MTVSMYPGSKSSVFKKTRVRVDVKKGASESKIKISKGNGLAQTHIMAHSVRQQLQVFSTNCNGSSHLSNVIKMFDFRERFRQMIRIRSDVWRGKTTCSKH